ncbi:MAG: hypothetical protein H0T95_01680 [Chthoniobacterales bacterium]|nr:hypothetical protein [Chthoniobacterales bacterium]
MRTLFVHSVPPRLPTFLRTLVKRFRWGPATVTGMALGYGIFVRADERGNRCLLIHELAHCAQSEQMGFRPFLEQYVHECLTAGYPDGRLEAEAKQIARDFI